jgi:maleylacetoacetate isomerase/maleylpyruvate isomerase
MELHAFFRSSTSYRLRLMLAAKGLEHAIWPISLPGGDHRSASFLDLNPQGLVPVLVDGGQVLTQSLAVMEYLEERYPDPPMMPGDPLERAYVRALSQIVACDIHPLNNARVLKWLASDLAVDPAGVQRWYAHWIAVGMSDFEALLARERRHSKFCLGDSLTIADLCLVPQIANARRFDCDLCAYPLSLAIAERVQAIAALAQAAPARQPDAA